MLLMFRDADGDPIAVDSAEIRGLSVGTDDRGQRAKAPVTVTLVWVAGVSQPFEVAAPFAEVLDVWTQARQATLPASSPPQVLAAHPGVFPLVAHQYPGLLHPSNRLPDPTPPWAEKKPSEEVQP